MTKYSTELKREIVTKYFDGVGSMQSLAQDYQIDRAIIRRWIKTAQANGISSLKVKHHHQSYSPEFKLAVVRYYLTKQDSALGTANYFKVNQAQVFTWSRKFNAEGIAGLKPKPKGRPAKMAKKRKQPKRKPLPLSEREQYEQAILERDAKIKDLEIDNLILKKVAARYPKYPTAKKPK